MTEPVIAQKEPCGVDVEEGNESVVCLWQERLSTFLRWFTQRDWALANAICRQTEPDRMVLRLQKDNERADM